MQTIAITLTDDHWVKLQNIATRLDIFPETLIVMGVEQILTHSPSSPISVSTTATRESLGILSTQVSNGQISANRRRNS